MVEAFASPQVFIRRYTAYEICDVVVSVRGQEIVLRCPNYFHALKWARLESKSYKFHSLILNHLAGWTTTNCRYFCALPKQLNEVASDQGCAFPNDARAVSKLLAALSFRREPAP